MAQLLSLEDQQRKFIPPPPSQQQIDYVKWLNVNPAEMKRLVDEYQGRIPPVPFTEHYSLPNPFDLYFHVNLWSIIISGKTINGPFTAQLIFITQVFQPNTTIPQYPFYVFQAFEWLPGVPLKLFGEPRTWFIQ